MKSVLIIGMGTLGRHLARKMTEFGNEVMIVDKDEDIIQEMAQEISNAIVGDCAAEGVLRSLGVNNFDFCFVTVGEDFYAALEITAILKELGAKCVISKAKKNRQAEFLKKIGADEVFYPEEEMAESLAIKYTVDNIYDYIELTDEYSVFEMPMIKEWIGKTIVEANVRKEYGINIIAIKNGGHMNPSPEPEYVFKEGDHIIVIGKAKDVLKISAKTSKKK
jgi:trk system potassium uptake protein TrkA